MTVSAISSTIAPRPFWITSKVIGSICWDDIVSLNLVSTVVFTSPNEHLPIQAAGDMEFDR